MSSVKALVVGSANGDLRNLCTKVATINSKHGPFDILFCTGNFFAKETPIETIDDLLENKLDFPITTYFIHGDHEVPGIIQRHAARNQGEICANLFYLGSHGVMTTAESVKMASLSGSYDNVVYEADKEQEGFDKNLLRKRYLKAEVEALIQSTRPASVMNSSAKKGVDVFLSHEWPAGITKDTTNPPQVTASTFSYPVARVTAALQPRYHFAAASGTFWERAPYRNTDGAEHATRFIALGDVGNKNKQRWFYAFNLVPLAQASEEVLKGSINAATTASPLGSAAPKRPRDVTEAGIFWDAKKMKGDGPPPGYVCRRCNQPGHYVKDCTAEQSDTVPEGYICNRCEQPGHFIRNCPKPAEPRVPQGYICRICNTPGHMIRDCPQSQMRSIPNPSGRRASGSNLIMKAPCWFCLSNPDIDKALIVSIGTEMYLTMAKGQLPTTPSNLVPGGGHVILITINHYSSFGAVEPEARSDVESERRKFKDGLRRLYESKGALMVSWELSQGGRYQHAHMQIMAIPKEKAQKVEECFRQELDTFFTTFKGDPEQGDPPVAAWQEEMIQREGYFKVELPDGRIMVCPIPDQQRVNAQFGREVMAKALGRPERGNWKACVKSADEERADSNAFKNAFKAFDFTL